jgi:hypothetical protein
MDELYVNYLSYLLRLWRTGASGGWQASLESPFTGERVGFPDLAALAAYLEAQTDAGPHATGTAKAEPPQ